MRGRHAMRPHLRKLRVRAQQLSPAHRWCCREGAKRSIAEKRILDRILKRGAKRKVASIELVDVDRGVNRSSKRQVGGPAADVSRHQRDSSRQFTLQINGKAMRARGSSGLIDEVDRAAGAGEQAIRGS